MKPSGPVREADLAAAPAHAGEFDRGPLLIGREHHPEGRDDDVEAAVVERQGLGVGLLEGNGKPLGLRPFAGPLQQRRHIVGRDDVAPAPRGGQRNVAVPGRDVEHALPGPQVEGFAQLLADDLEGGAHHRVVAGGPGPVLTGLEGGVIGSRRDSAGGERECRIRHGRCPFLRLPMVAFAGSLLMRRPRAAGPPSGIDGPT